MQVTHPKTIDRYYQALVEKNPSFTGVFFAAVKTTSVFCIATCRARKPLKQNVDFYKDFKAALHAGYRPCKICKPTENANEAPLEVQTAIARIQSSPKKRVSDGELLQAGLNPERIRRWFQKQYGMTFQCYQRMYRINTAMLELGKGSNSLETAYELGYESLSGFAYTYKKITGHSPGEGKYSAILINRFTTPLGPMFACATAKGLCLLEFVDRRMLETEFRDLQRRLQCPIVTGENAHIAQAKNEIAEYFRGQRQHFSVALDMPGSEFQQQVWQGLCSIPFGETRSYQQQAEALGRKQAVRAVANANGHNRISIIVPCHRVIGKNGNLTGYGGGLERKRWLLEHEKQYECSIIPSGKNH